jgi:hypothetical protein
MLKVTEHAVLPPPADEDVRALVRLDGLTEDAAEAKLIAEREAAIEAEKIDPLVHGWENPTWRVVAALLGLGALRPRWEAYAQEQFGMTWEAACESFRKALGFPRPVKDMLLLGGNRTAKSELAALLGVLILFEEGRRKVLWGHEQGRRSREEQQPLIFKYFPPGLREQIKKRKIATAEEYISYREKRGFSDDSFMLDNMSMGIFRYYEQDWRKVLEGLKLDAAFVDELVPEDWVDTLQFRVAELNGFVLTTFTPKDGYSPAVKRYCDGMQVLVHDIGYCLPEDGGPVDIPRALGLDPKELDQLEWAEVKKEVAPHPQSRPDDLMARVLKGQPLHGGEMPEGRSFERVPRIARGMAPETAIIWMHGRDNPFGNPKVVMKKALASRKGKDEVRISVYGIPTKAIGSAFVKFRRNTHVVPARNVPPTGTNYMLLDPHSGRNHFMLWIRAAATGKNFTYREWPGNYDIPGVGVPEPWAVPSGRNKGKNDGAQGGGQKGFGFGHWRYKFEIARLEGWNDWQRWMRDKFSGDEIPNPDVVEEWKEENGAREVIARRLIDARAGETSSVRNDEPVTLIKELEEVGLIFETAIGSGVEGGLTVLVNALDYNDSQPIGFGNSPTHFCADDCLNSIFMFENYQNADGEKGAMKDVVDPHRWFYTAGLGFVGDAGLRRRGNLATGRWETGGDADGLAERERMRRAGKDPLIDGERAPRRARGRFA